MRWKSLEPIAIALGIAGCGLEPSGAAGQPASEVDAGIDATVHDAAITSAIDSADDVDPEDTGMADDATSAADIDVSDALPIADASTVDALDSDVPDVTADAAGDAACPGALCNGVCLPSLDCSACTAAPLFCAGTRTCTTSCATCAGNGPPRPIECYRCDANRLNPIGTCEPRDTNAYCLNGSGYGTATHCGCGGNVPCPGSTLVCTDIGVGVPICATCGEPASDKLSCVGGGRCDAMKQRCN